MKSHVTVVKPKLFGFLIGKLINYSYPETFDCKVALQVHPVGVNRGDRLGLDLIFPIDEIPEFLAHGNRILGEKGKNVGSIVETTGAKILLSGQDNWLVRRCLINQSHSVLPGLGGGLVKVHRILNVDQRKIEGVWNKLDIFALRVQQLILVTICTFPTGTRFLDKVDNFFFNLHQ